MTDESHGTVSTSDRIRFRVLSFGPNPMRQLMPSADQYLLGIERIDTDFQPITNYGLSDFTLSHHGEGTIAALLRAAGSETVYWADTGTDATPTGGRLRIPGPLDTVLGRTIEAIRLQQIMSTS